MKNLPEKREDNSAALVLIKCRERLGRFGLTLSEKDACELIETRNDALLRNGRVEFGGEIISRLILEFCDSPFIGNENFVQTINELLDIFYYYKNELPDDFPDSELISRMKELFDGCCGGSLELLGGKELEKFTRGGPDDEDDEDCGDGEDETYDF